MTTVDEIDVAILAFVSDHKKSSVTDGAKALYKPSDVYELQKKDESTKDLENSKTDIGWGHQIRSYVLQPYRLVKDLRNNFENTNPDSVLNGDIDGFLENSLFKLKVNKQ